MTANLYIPESAMSIQAHPDDIEFTCAGTLARWARLGTRVAYVLCTSGDVGIDEPGMTRARATEIREAEAHAAASGSSALGRMKVLYGEAAAAFQTDPDLSRAVMRSSAQRLCCPGGGGAPWHQFETTVLGMIAEGQKRGEIRSDLDLHVMHGALVSCFVGGVMWWLGERGNGHTKRRSMTLREVIAALQGVTMDGMKTKRNGK